MSKGSTVQAELERGAIVLARRDRLAQVFANLLQNTLRYTDAPGRLEVALRREGGGSCVDWEDSRPACRRADLGRLTERLYRVDASRSRAGGGSGLGSAIVKAIVDATAGRCVARAEPARRPMRWRSGFRSRRRNGRWLTES